MVVLRVADPDGVVNRDPQREQRLTEACGLGDRLRQHHQTPAVERENQRLLQRSNCLEDRRGPSRVGFDHGFAGHEGDLAPLQLLEKRRVRRMANDDVAAGRRKLQHRAVLADHDVEAREIASHLPQIVQPAPGDEDDDNPGLPGDADRLADAGVEPAVDGDRAVVIECDG